MASYGVIWGRRNVRSLAESGYKNFEADLWYGVVAPAKTARETLSQLADLFAAKLSAQGLYPAGLCGADFRAYLQYDEYGRVIREANIKAE
jgi:tripartite-type tricarboxylate transporter receptor subunit TctC